MKNGVVLPPVSIEPGKSFTFVHPQMQMENLNRALLYWEDVSTPMFASPRIFRTPYLDKILQLHKQKLLQIPDYAHVMATNTLDTNVDSTRLFKLYDKMRQTKGESWSLLAPEGMNPIETCSNETLKLQGSRQRALHIGLVKQLPVPSASVNPMKIIDFRNKNLEHLRAFHHALNEFAAKYSQLSDEEEPLLQAQAELADAMEGYTTRAQNRVAKGGLRTLEFSLLMASTGAGAVIGGVPGAIIGSLAGHAGCKLISTIEAKIPKTETASPFFYAMQSAKLAEG